MKGGPSLADSAYRDQVDAKRILQIRAITRELPQATRSARQK